MYRAQISPYLKAFGRANIFLIHFEQFIHDHKQIMKNLCRFMNINEAQENQSSVLQNRKPGEPWVQKLYQLHTMEGAVLQKMKSPPYYIGRVIAPLVSRKRMYKKTAHLYEFTAKQRSEISLLFNYIFYDSSHVFL